MRILITGMAGFIGHQLAKKLASRGDFVVGIDCINDYYDPNLKLSRLKDLGFDTNEIEDNKVISSKNNENIKFIKANLEDYDTLYKLFDEFNFDATMNLAAQAGVRYSLINPLSYVQSNLVGFANLLECARYHNIKHFVYASSSSTYGLNSNVPYSEHNAVNHPISLYAASKKSNELMAHTYSHLFKIPTTGLRYFTVYGPWGRPDMALSLFMDKALKDEPIDVFNYGKMKRDFTYIDDIVNGTIAVIDHPAKPNPNWDSNNPDPVSSSAPYRVYNIGNNKCIELMEYIKALELALGKEIKKNFMEIQPGDVEMTYANVDDLINEIGYRPDTDLNVGVKNFVDWYLGYYGK